MVNICFSYLVYPASLPLNINLLMAYGSQPYKITKATFCSHLSNIFCDHIVNIVASPILSSRANNILSLDPSAHFSLTAFRPSTNHGIENSDSEIEAYVIDANLCQLLIQSKTDRSTDILISPTAGFRTN